MLFLQFTRRDRSLALTRTDNRSAARIPIIAMTTSSSMRVNELSLRSRLLLVCDVVTIGRLFEAKETGELTHSRSRVMASAQKSIDDDKFSFCTVSLWVNIA